MKYLSVMPAGMGYLSDVPAGIRDISQMCQQV
jgi:hypothetical protein